MPIKKRKDNSIYCGGDKLPKGKVYGSLQQCINSGQIRLFGSIDKLNYEKKVINNAIENAEDRLRKSSGGKDSQNILKTIGKLNTLKKNNTKKTIEVKNVLNNVKLPNKKPNF